MKKLLLVFLALGSLMILSACPDGGEGGEGAATTENMNSGENMDHNGDHSEEGDSH